MALTPNIPNLILAVPRPPDHLLRDMLSKHVARGLSDAGPGSGAFSGSGDGGMGICAPIGQRDVDSFRLVLADQRERFPLLDRGFSA